MTYYKVLKENGRSSYADHPWPLPNGAPGAWVEVSGELVACKNGLHVCDAGNLIEWLGSRIFTVECDPEPVRLDGKLITSRARLLEECMLWDERRARIFAAHCALDVIDVYEKEHPGNPLPREAITAALQFAQGEIARDEMFAASDAASSAAWVAASAASSAAAGAAAGAAARGAAWAAASSAAWAAARAAARDAAWAAAGAACRRWQSARLMRVLTDPAWPAMPMAAGA